MDSSTYEKLGVFYMGRSFDIEAGQTGADPVLYDSKDLTTHAVIVGMTGSGKTGPRHRDAGRSRHRRHSVDRDRPQGDLGNLLLSFPD